MLISRDIADLDKSIKMLCLRFIEECKRAGIDILITCTRRDNEAQDWLYASGRTRIGAILTNARAGQSKHNFGKAFDFCVMTGGKCDWSNTEEFKSAGLIAESLGLKWAGRWRGGLREIGHIETDS